MTGFSGKQIVTVLILLVVISAFAPVPAMACPTCKDGIANSAGHANMVRGYQMSIVFMMLMPFLVLTGMGTYFYLEVRKARALQAVAAQQSGNEQAHEPPSREAAPA